MLDVPRRPDERWVVLAVLALAECLAMTLWFSASAVVPQLDAALGLSAGQQAWLTMSVQLGFVLGALASAVTNLADRYPAHRVFAVSALLGAAANGLIAVLPADFGTMVVLRLITGMTLAGVYPVGMKLMASWFTDGRGVAIGILVGALTLGSAVPHLLNALPGSGGVPPWRAVVGASSGLTVVAALAGGLFIRPGPALPGSARFDPRYAARLWTEPSLRYANFGYLGHMWELYAVWTWVPLLLLEVYAAASWPETWARAAGFALVATGGLGSVVAGVFADRLGRTRVAGASLLVSGACCLVAGFALDAPAVLTAICLVWGFAVVADSAQFSAAVSELCDPAYVGTALTMQTCAGFLLTLLTIRMVPPLVDAAGWQVALAVLALGPAFGVWSMVRLRGRPDAARMAQGNR